MMRRWRYRGMLASVLMVVAAGSGGAEDFAALYTADAIVTGTDMRQRPWGFAQCLTEVLAKVAGDPRLKDDPRVAAAAEHADGFVTAFDYVDLMAGIKKKDDQGSYDRPHRLTVHFDPAKIDALLSELGETPWRGERPVVVPVLLVHGPKPPSYLLSTDEPRGEAQRGSFRTWADASGIAVRFPSAAELAEWGATADHLPAVPPASPPGQAIVLGTLEWSETLPGWIGQWRLRSRDADHAWGISGVNYDAAFRDILRGVVLLASGRGSPD
jgi:hypothetical protein